MIDKKNETVSRIPQSDEWPSTEEFKPIKRERTSRIIEKQIKAIIFKKGLQVGTKLPTERQLAETFNVSRTSVREALRSMERSGLLSIKKGSKGGAFFSGTLSPHVAELMIDMFDSGQVSLEEILNARLIIEPQVAAEIAGKAVPEQIARLKETIGLLRQGYKSGDPKMENNPRFHHVLGQMSNNRVIQLIMRVLMVVHKERMSFIRLDNAAKKRIIREHEGLIDAIAQHDPELASERMRQHILSVHGIHSKIEDKEQKL
ncbi:FadR/GntR family transcriptional regulator [Desulfobacula sp.]|uniref:FadR/GntR family transcriptional regulator n=1 Tax=Desulfobacula sp. TaxID=2593537 RepID=UPI002610CC89|nr:FadR/GntR family transcriptional regulator [Desulfobacula sp.]